MNESDERLQALLGWLHEACNLGDFELAPASGDASFRRYFRVTTRHRSFIAMDAPPDKEDVGAFVKVAHLLQQAGAQVPEILMMDLGQGFLLLGDLGVRLYLDELDESRVDRLYGDAMEALLRIQRGVAPSPAGLPDYDRQRLYQEMALFDEWFLARHLETALTDAQRASLETAYDVLVAAALEQPVACVHRDYHSRNLLVTERDNPGILDFQDAVRGPITYDLVSLLRDCYIAWPRQRVESWAREHRERLVAEGLLPPHARERFLAWFDLMGIQRHLKAIGIFARLYHRDGKPGYLADIPRTLNYVLDVARRYPELSGLHGLLGELDLPRRLQP